MTLDECETFARAMMDEYGLKDWRFAVMNRNATKTLGLCNYTSKTISVSLRHIEEDTTESVKDTVLHEIAHALTRGAGHGPVWKLMCLRIGAIPVATKKSAIKRNPKWVLVFEGQVVAQYHRKPKMNLERLYVIGRKDETHGKLKPLDYGLYQQAAATADGGNGQ